MRRPHGRPSTGLGLARSARIARDEACVQKWSGGRGGVRVPGGVSGGCLRCARGGAAGKTRPRSPAASPELLHDCRRRRQHRRPGRRGRRDRRGRRLRRKRRRRRRRDQRITPRPIRYIIDTNADADHVGGNETLSKAGQTLFTNPGSIGITGDFLGGVASILAAQKVLERMTAPTGRAAPYPVGAMPTETFDYRAEIHVPERRGDRDPASAGRAHATATRWCSSADRTSSWPATCSTRRGSR